MPDEDILDSLLNAWETRSPDVDLDIFLRRHASGLSASDRKEFRRRIAALANMDLRLASIDETRDEAGDTPLVTSTKQRIFPWDAGDEPIAGYALVQRIGEGGFGSVWKATGPGGFPVALKFVRLAGRAGAIEQRSLEIMRGLRHANLLSVAGTWHVNNWLIIVTELADKTLFDRYEEHRAAGKPGIPRQELLDYMLDAARGIDFLNEPAASGRPKIQHRDIKPQNLLLSGGSVKVGDFGLARVLASDSTGHTGSLTLAYAAPEFLDGRTSSRSDQYSLAITYCHLLGGKLPFDGSHAQVIDGHRLKSPDLSMLPEKDQPIVRKALAKNAGERWNSCTEFVRALKVSSPIPPVIKRRQAPTITSKRPRRSPRRSRWGFLATVAGGVLLLLSSWSIAPSFLPSESPPRNSTGERFPLAASSRSPEVEDTRPSNVAVPPRRVNSTEGPTSHWELDDVEQNQLVDLVGMRNGRVHGDPQAVEGIIGRSLRFNGEDDYIVMPPMDFGPRFTFTAWVRPRESKASQCIFATKPPDVFGGNGFPGGIALFLNSNSPSTPNRRVHFQIHGATISTGGAGFEFDEWTHLAVAVDAPDQQVNLFIDGKVGESLIIRRPPGPYSRPEFVNDEHQAIRVEELAGKEVFHSEWRIGAFNDPKTIWYPFWGEIDEVRFYDRDLSIDEVAALASQR